MKKKIIRYARKNATYFDLQYCPVAQWVERWTPCGGSTRPGYESPGFEARQARDVYETPGGYGYGW